MKSKLEIENPRGTPIPNLEMIKYTCKCGEWMQELEKDFGGFPSLIRTEPTLNKK